MPGSTFGHMFRFTSWGESHGPAIGVVVDGVPPRIPLSEADVQRHLDRRRPGSSRFVTRRREADRVEILSGVFNGLTTGAPVSMIIRNEDVRSKDYEEIRDLYRPGHADFTYEMKYGIRDWRGGGRASARETACRVAAGAVARRVLGEGVDIFGYVVRIGAVEIDRGRFDRAEIDRNPFFCPDPGTVPLWEELLTRVRKEGSSVGAVVEVVARGVPPGLGDPVYDRLDADLAKAMMSINAVKGVEIGAGFAAAGLRGEENADEMVVEDGRVRFLSNNAGGILGGVSTGQDIVVRFAVKPTSSILIPRRTVDRLGRPREIRTRGRHDPCVGIRAVPVGEAMMACVLADHLLRQRALEACAPPR